MANDQEVLQNDEKVPISGSDHSCHKSFRIILYYTYVPLGIHTPNHVDFQRDICNELLLKGRIRVSSEGLNGVLSGYLRNLEKYEDQLRKELDRIMRAGEFNSLSSPYDLDIKYCDLREDLTVNSQLFDYLSVKLTDQVVSLVDCGTEQKVSPDVIQRFQGTSPFLDRPVAPRLTPDEWNRKLLQLSRKPQSRVVLLDCRNVYESNIGYFRAPNATTVLTNTRKFSELPGVLFEYANRLAKSTHIFSFCTGGVRCERATVLLHEILQNYCRGTSGSTGCVPQIYQLHGGIQRYLESSNTQYYFGKNFVFDPRRTDPVHTREVVGSCLVCGLAHDDYDNGHAASENKEARCYKCRIMVLVCNTCRPIVIGWNDNEEAGKKRMYCGGLAKDCVHMPPVREIYSEPQLEKVPTTDSN